MAHKEQREFCQSVKNKLPEYFTNKTILDVGSLDVNGNNRWMFDSPISYTGIDIGEGHNVDMVSKGHEFNAPDETYDVIISTECFEHDMFYPLTLKNIVRMLSTNGLFLFTCATTGRPEHGTITHDIGSAPLLKEEWANYYKNLTEKDVRDVLDIEKIFRRFNFSTNETSKDLYFWGIKN